MDLLFRQSDGSPLRIVHSHVPGDPQNPGLPELASYVARANKDECPLVVVGDLNFVVEEVQQAFQEKGLANPIMILRLNTCVDTRGTTKGIDHIVVFNPRIPCFPVAEEAFPNEVRKAQRMLNQGEV